MTKSATPTTNNDEDKLDNMWEDMDEGKLDAMDPVVTPCTVPLINVYTATIKRLTNDGSRKKTGLRVQLDGQCVSQLGKCKKKWKNGPGKSKQATFRQKQCGKATRGNCVPA